VTFPVKRECNKAESNALTSFRLHSNDFYKLCVLGCQGCEDKPTRDRFKTINEIEKSKCVLITVYIPRF